MLLSQFEINIQLWEKTKNNVIIYVDDNSQDIFLDATKAVLKK